ncbi:hypothetical protein HPP92_016004 [Vanilla planifolia]|uniref:Uncharacterized protein n=1 Tax=Vanilla planifolia TaxID=51239 RepID=A0A835QUM9_VANPL|nr:hypothetical protein HPP92_016004 [Vanilla planifolia]
MEISTTLSKVGPAVYMPVIDSSQIDLRWALTLPTIFLTQQGKKRRTMKLFSPAKRHIVKVQLKPFSTTEAGFLVFCKRPPTATEGMLTALYDSAFPTKARVARTKKRYIPRSADRTLDAPDLVDDFYLNLLD